MPTYAYAFEGECYDIGTHDSLAQVNEKYSQKEYKLWKEEKSKNNINNKKKCKKRK